MLESIKNAVMKLTDMGVLNRKEVQRRRGQPPQRVLELSDTFDKEEGLKLAELYDAIVFYMPDPAKLNLKKILSEIRKIMMSDITLMPKL